MNTTALDLQTAFQLVIAITGLLGGWFLKVLFSRIDKLEQANMALSTAVAELRVELPTHYVSKGDFRQMGDNIFAALRRIEDKLDGKADKE